MLEGVTEDNVLTALVHDDVASAQIAMKLDHGLFSTRGYRQIAEKAIQYVQKYKRAPGMHCRDELEDKMRGTSAEAAFFVDTFEAMDKIKHEIHTQYILDKLDEFIEKRRVIIAIQKAADAAHQGDIEKARKYMYEATVDKNFNHGIWLQKPEEGLRFMNAKEEEDFFPSGVDDLDKRGVRPHRKKMFLILAPSNKGKSWWLVEIGKQCAFLYKKSVLHVTLEMSEDDVAERYIQAMFAMARGDDVDSIRTSFFEKDEFGRFVGFEYGSTRSAQGLRSEMRSQVEKKLKAFQQSKPILIKEFPTSSLSIEQLESYLDMLEQQHNFVPDILILDYADLMDIDPTSLRIDTGHMFRRLRGLMNKRNMALATATQGSRKAAESNTTRETHIAEDWSKVGTTDFLVTYSQTELEEKRGFARLLVEKARTAKKHYTVMISQSYETGQFCLSSVYMNKSAQDTVRKVLGSDDDAKT